MKHRPHHSHPGYLDPATTHRTGYHGRHGRLVGIAAAVVVVALAAGGGVVLNGHETANRAVTAPSGPAATSTTTTTEPPTTTTTAAPVPVTEAPTTPTASNNPAPPTSPPVTAAPPAPTPAPAGLAGEVVAAMNASRASEGLAPLGYNGTLGGIAQAWANWMAQNASLTHQNLGSIIGRTGFTTMGENLLVGPAGTTATQMEAAWMASAGHRANIMKDDFSATGVGAAISADGRIWVAVDFGG